MYLFIYLFIHMCVNDSINVDISAINSGQPSSQQTDLPKGLTLQGNEVKYPDSITVESNCTQDQPCSID